MPEEQNKADTIEHPYTETYTNENENTVKYRRTVTLPEYGTVTVELYLTKAYLQGQQKHVIENYLNHAVTDILTRSGVTQDADI